MDKEAKDISYILTIPPEVRGQIFNLLNAQDASSCRLVCQIFKEDVDDFVEYRAEVDESNGHLTRVLSLRLREMKVKNLMGPPPSGHVGTRLLSHPHLLRKLTLPNSKISVSNLHYLLVDCQGSFETLEWNINSPLSTAFTGLNLNTNTFSYKLPKLLSLALNICTIPSPDSSGDLPFVRGPPSIIPNDTVTVLLLSSPIERLHALRIQVRCLGWRQVSQLSSLILRLVSRTSKTLKSLEFDLIQGHGVPSSEERDLVDSDLEILDFKSLEKVNGLEEMRIINSTAVGIPYWARLLSNQKKLKCLETDILPAPAALFRQIILNNGATLIELDIGDLTLDEDNGQTLPFDISVFCECTSLRKLTLDRNSTLARSRREATTTELVNLSSLPQTLEELNLNYFLVSSEELAILFSSLPSLQSLSLTQCGDSGSFGVDGTVMQQILLLPSVQFIEISPLNFQHGEEEVQKLNLILTTFGYPEGHSYFQLKRVEPLVMRVQIDMQDFYPLD